MAILIRAGAIHVLELQTRMPFKYGIATMTRAPHAFVRLEVDIDGRMSIGLAADLLPPKWFTKDPSRSLDDEVAEMARVIEHAVGIAEGMSGESPFALWRHLWTAQAEWGRQQGLPPLLTHFGTSLVERALIEAFCRAAGEPFATLLYTNRLGIRLGDIHPELQGRTPADFLPQRPLERVVARHTVGLADPLEDVDIAPGERLDDGLPQSLPTCIRTYGLRHFKIKVNGQIDRDVERLTRIAAVIAAAAPADFAFSLDGNEQFRSADDFTAFWIAITSVAHLQDFFKHLLFVEQPVHRDLWSAAVPRRFGFVAAAASQGGVERPSRDPIQSGVEPPKSKTSQSGVEPPHSKAPPVIIDESDGDLHSLAEALRLGYAGTSHKNCKGIFKSIANACLLAHRRRTQPDHTFILSGEDLANIGPVALLQDLAVCAALGIASVERNGHHYFAGLSMFPAGMQQQVLAAHGDLYHASMAGWPTLTLRDGMLDLASINRAPFGVQPQLDLGGIPTLAAWRSKL